MVKEVGNGAATRIPASVPEAAHMRLDQLADVREEQGRIIIEPLHSARYDLRALVVGMTDENRHEPTEWDRLRAKGAGSHA